MKLISLVAVVTGFVLVATGDATGGRTKTLPIGSGKYARDHGIAFTAESMKVVSSVRLRDSFDATYVRRAERGAKIVLVRVKFRNVGRKPMSPFCTFEGGGAMLIDTANRNFSPWEIEGEGGNDRAQDRFPGNDACRNLQPGFGQTMTVIFLVPSQAKPRGIALWNPTGDNYYGGRSYVVFVGNAAK